MHHNISEKAVIFVKPKIRDYWLGIRLEADWTGIGRKGLLKSFMRSHRSPGLKIIF